MPGHRSQRELVICNDCESPITMWLHAGHGYKIKCDCEFGSIEVPMGMTADHKFIPIKGRWGDIDFDETPSEVVCEKCEDTVELTYYPRDGYHITCDCTRGYLACSHSIITNSLLDDQSGRWQPE